MRQTQGVISLTVYCDPRYGVMYANRRTETCRICKSIPTDSAYGEQNHFDYVKITEEAGCVVYVCIWYCGR